MTKASGKVYLVGAGPGDPGLITVRGRELLERADVVIYDSLVDEGLLNHAPRAETIFVGKRPNRHTLPQDDINRILIEQARKANCVVRLKGGDPFVFGRGGEEALALASAGIAFEIVPGVTAGVGATAYAGIPVTHRGKTASVSFITGHLDPSQNTIDYSKLHLEGTLVFYMAVKHMPAITRSLVEQGRSPKTPAAVVQLGTFSNQQSIVGTLEDIAQRCEAVSIVSPAVLIVGDVVDLREQLSWFENRPLYGKRVAVTRTRRRAGELVSLLRERGADVFEFPTIEIERPETPQPLDDVTEFDWIILTSVNSVDTLFQHMLDQGLDARALQGVKLCAVGGKTEETLGSRFIKVDAAPEGYETDQVVAALEKAAGPLDEQRILIPRADIVRSSLHEALEKRGATVTELQAYRTAVPPDTGDLADALVAYAPHYVTFTSAAAAYNFSRIMGADRLESMSEQTQYAAIGPIASEAAREQGLDSAIVPKRHRVSDLVDAIVEWEAQRGD